MTDLETQVRAALDQLAATIEHLPGCPFRGKPLFVNACTCDREGRLRAAWSQATARAMTAIGGPKSPHSCVPLCADCTKLGLNALEKS